jgi:hypothetical protein
VVDSQKWAQLGSNADAFGQHPDLNGFAILRQDQRPPDYELVMRVSTDLHRFVSVCTSLFCSTIIVKDFTDLYRYGENTGPKLAPKFEKSDD